MGVRLSGEIDITSAPQLAAQLEARIADEDLVVETSELSFIDVAACRALIEAAERLSNGWRLRFPDPGDALVRVLQGCGWTEHPRLELS